MSDEMTSGLHLGCDAADVFQLHFVNHVDGVVYVGLDDGEERAVRTGAVGAAELRRDGG